MWIDNVSTLELCVVVFFMQILFILFRTLNVVYTAELNHVGSMLTGSMVHICWLVTITIGVKSVMYMDVWVILCSLTGGLSGTYVGIKMKKYLNKRKNGKSS